MALGSRNPVSQPLLANNHWFDAEDNRWYHALFIKDLGWFRGSGSNSDEAYDDVWSLVEGDPQIKHNTEGI